MNDEWNAQAVLDKWLARSLALRDTKVTQHQINNMPRLHADEPVPLALLEAALVQLAELHSLYGDRLLPLFHRMEDEVKLANERLDIKQRIRHINEGLSLANSKGDLF